MHLPASISRRGLLRTAALGFGAAAGSMSGWLPALAAAPGKKPAKSVIVLWMNGGPATIDLWDLKSGHENGGPFKAIQTAAPGVEIGEHLPKLAAEGKELALIRSMTTREGDHDRATFLLRTGYIPMGAIRFPAVGSLISKELALEMSELPGFVSIAPARYAASIGGGFLDPRHDPLTLGEGASSVEGLKVPDLSRIAGIQDDAQGKRLAMLSQLESRFRQSRSTPVVESVQAATDRALRLMSPSAAAAFELQQEPEKLRAAYGASLFGQGVLLARRLVERGVPFVEVTLDGWDTHQDNFGKVKDLCGTLDAAFSTLISDLRDRGLLESTLVLCQGEFGRTPKINSNTGRDHWPASWAVAMAGGGIQSGQAVGKTSADGTKVEERPISVPDLIATVAKVAGIDPERQNMSNVGRPIRIAAPDAEPIREIL